MKIIIADKFKDFNDWVDPETLGDIISFESKKKDNFEVYEAEANEVDIPDVTTDEEAEGMLADSYVQVQTEEPFGENLGDFGDIGRTQEGLREEPVVEEPLIKKRDEVDDVDESVAEETEIDDRVKEFSTARGAVQAAMDEHRVLEIFYVTRGRGSRDDKYYLKRERGLQREEGGGVNIHRIVEPHHIYTAGNGSEIVITYDRSVRRVRSFIINNIYDYNFTKNRRTKKDQYFKPRNRVMPTAKAAGSRKGIKTMKNINDTLVKIASALDEQGLKESSNVVKNAEKALSNYKMAQYVGVQGYWLRNRRCWDNCYRQKRSAKPGGSAQEVWMECWDEYREAINNPKSTWAKYASKRDSVKVGGKEEQDWNKIFAGKVEDKMKTGLSRPESIYTVIEAETQASADSQIYIDKVIKASSDLMVLADTLVSNGYEEVGKQAAKMSIGMLKEADIGGLQQNFIGKGIDKAKNFFGGFRGKGSSLDVRKKIETVISRAYGLLKMLSGSNVRQAQSAGFVIEAGKGTTITKEAYTKEQLDKDNAAEAAKSKGTPGEQGVFPFAQPQAGDPPTKETGGDGIPDGDEDLNKNNQPDGQEDKNKNNQPDGQEDLDKNGIEDGKEDKAGGDDDVDNDGVNNEQDVDDSPADNIPDDQQQQAKQPSLRESYTSLMDDVSTLTTELSGLQSAKDPQVSQWAQGAVPLLHKFVTDSSVINQTSKGERTQAIKQIVIQLAKGLQGVLAGQAQTAQPGGLTDQTGGLTDQTGGLGGIPQGNQNTGGAGISQIVQDVASKGASIVQGLSQVLNGNALKQTDLLWVMDTFEKNGVPLTSANLTQFKKELAAMAAPKQKVVV